MLFLLILFACFLLQFTLPWWIIAPVSAVATFWLGKRASSGFTSAFFAVLLLWIGMSLLKTLPNENILLNRVVGIFGLPPKVWARVILVVATGLVGGLVAGLCALSGFYWRKALEKNL